MEKSFRNIEDFLTDESFRSWVINPTPELENHWLDWINKNPQKKVMLDQSREMILSLKFKEYKPDPKSKQLVLDRVKQETRPRASVIGLRSVWLKVAAVALIVVSTITLIYVISVDQQQPSLYTSTEILHKSNAPGMRSQHLLPDGSTVFLNAGSFLEYPETFDTESRRVKLQGEAFFEVTHDAKRPFRVETEGFEVVVLGTQFNINTAQSSPSVALVEGRVRLNSSSSDATMELSPSQMAIFDKENSSFTSTSFDHRYVTGWKDGYLVFREASFDEVVEKLHSWYGVEVSVLNKPTSSDWSYTASFKQETLENVLFNMSTLRRFDHQIRNDSLFLSF